mgnify:CR=1 FL=1
MSIKSKLHEIKESFKGKKMAPAFNAFHTFLFTPNDVTSSGTHVKVADDLKRTMNTVIMSLVPCLIFGILSVELHRKTTYKPNGSQREARKQWFKSWLLDWALCLV